MKKATIFMVIAAASLLLVYVSSLKSQLSEAAALQESYKEEIEELSAVREGAAQKSNKAFLERFFNYTDTKKRNKELKPYMTDGGFQSIQPEASIDQKTEVKVSASNIKIYERKDGKKEAEFLNEMELTIDFNDADSTEKVFVRTKLLYVSGEGWKVDSVEYIGELKRKAGEAV